MNQSASHYSPTAPLDQASVPQHICETHQREKTQTMNEWTNQPPNIRRLYLLIKPVYPSTSVRPACGEPWEDLAGNGRKERLTQKSSSSLRDTFTRSSGFPREDGGGNSSVVRALDL